MDKINLIYGEGDVFHTHLNINPFAENADGKTVVRDDVSNLDKYADDSELTELIAVDVIDFIPANKTSEVIDNWVKKIRIGGKIVIGGVDLFEVCKCLSQYKIDISDANALIHGQQNKPYMLRKVNFTAIGISEYLKDRFGFEIISKNINNFKMSVEARRPS